MVKLRKAVSKHVKDALIREAGMKCANPGCANHRTHFHHIKEWAVYETSDQKHMIAICPTCHDAVHYGTLAINNDTLYQWKKIQHTSTNRAHIYIEPSISSKLLLGSIAVTGDSGLTVFELSPSNKLSFRLIDGDIFLVNLKITTVSGKEVVRVVDNHVRHTDEDIVSFNQRPGKIRITAFETAEFLKTWAIVSLRVQEPNYSIDGQLILLDIEVLEPGLVRIQGIWTEDKHAIVITLDRIAFISPKRQQPLSICGEGANTVLNYTGSITSALFGL
jgi:hypothetical protein